MKILGTLHRLDDTRGAVRIEDVYATDIEDLWDACTQPERLGRWIASVSGDLVQHGEFTARFTSGWEGNGRVDVCERPHRLRLTTWEDESPDLESTLEATLTAVDGGTRLIIEESGVPVSQLAPAGRCTRRTWRPMSPAVSATRTRRAGSTWCRSTKSSWWKVRARMSRGVGIGDACVPDPRYLT